jgi:hypothetical protein
MQFVAHQVLHRIWDAVRGSSMRLQYDRKLYRYPKGRSRTARRAKGEGATQRSEVARRRGTLPRCQPRQLFGIPKAQRSGHKHRCEHSPALCPPRCATRPERGTMPMNSPFDPLERHILSLSAQPGIAADRFAREIGAILEASASALAAAECQDVSPPHLSLPVDPACLCYN